MDPAKKMNRGMCMYANSSKRRECQKYTDLLSSLMRKNLSTALRSCCFKETTCFRLCYLSMKSSTSA